MVALARSYTLPPPSLRQAATVAYQTQTLRAISETVEVITVPESGYDEMGRPLRVLSVEESGFPYGCSLFGSAEIASLNELASQHDHWPREILVLMEDGLQSYPKLRPIDWLAIHLQHQHPSYQPVLQEFFEEYGKDEACAMCYALACTDFNSLPRESVLRAGSSEEVRKNALSLLNRGLTIGESLAGAPTHVGAPAEQALANLSPVAAGSAVPQWTKTYSHRFNGLQLYAARLLCGVWKKPVVTKDHDLTFKHPEHWKLIVTGLDR
jgi:hypothetical protein